MRPVYYCGKLGSRAWLEGTCTVNYLSYSCPYTISMVAVTALLITSLTPIAGKEEGKGRRGKRGGEREEGREREGDRGREEERGR